jgi:hypothetical protein
MSPPRRTRDAIAQSRLFVCFITPAYLRDPRASAELVYAVQLGKPIRLLVSPGLRLPEAFLAGVPDLQAAVVATPDEAQAQIRAWLEAL